MGTIHIKHLSSNTFYFSKSTSMKLLGIFAFVCVCLSYVSTVSAAKNDELAVDDVSEDGSPLYDINKDHSLDVSVADLGGQCSGSHPKFCHDDVNGAEWCCRADYLCNPEGSRHKKCKKA